MRPTDREDLSRFLVHLTRDFNGNTAEDNLLAMLKDQRIEARSAYCLFHKKFDQFAFSKVLKKRFRSVCLTEVPFTQLRHLAADISGRQIKLRPYGLVFRKLDLLERGASPAIYINAKGTSLRDYLVSQFDSHFKERSQYKKLKKDFGDEAESIINYYSLINVINSSHDFSWEREWRYPGNLSFDFVELFAVIANDPDSFSKRYKKVFSGELLRQMQYIPIVSLQWNAERIIEELSIKLWTA
jgi:hypothetical protein